MLEKIYQLEGGKVGPTSIILAGVHGDEICGVEAIKKILPGLKIERGVVLFGYGNPRAIKMDKRYTEVNLNRMFSDNFLSTREKETYEYGRAQFLKKCLDKAEALLDIHASSIPESKAFAICEANAGKIVKFLPIDLVVSGFDEVEPGGTDHYMNSTGKIGICLECGYVKNPESLRVAEKGIVSFLKSRGHLENKLAPQKQSFLRVFKKYLAKTDNFTLAKPFKNFEIVEKKQVIGIDGQEKIKAPKRSLILFAHNGVKIGDEIFLLGEKKKTLCSFSTTQGF